MSGSGWRAVSLGETSAEAEAAAAADFKALEYLGSTATARERANQLVAYWLSKREERRRTTDTLVDLVRRDEGPPWALLQRPEVVRIGDILHQSAFMCLIPSLQYHLSRMLEPAMWRRSVDCRVSTLSMADVRFFTQVRSSLRLLSGGLLANWAAREEKKEELMDLRLAAVATALGLPASSSSKKRQRR